MAIELVLGMLIALVMHRRSSAAGPIRAAVLIPYGIITVVAALGWRYAWAADTGFVPGLLGLTTDPLTDRNQSFIVIILTEVWKTTPFMALLLLAGLALVPDELHEAAKVDGASARQRFFRITLPLMKPAILVALLFRTLDAFRVFDSIFILTRGANNTESVSILGYNQLVNRLNLGIGSAVSVLIFICVALIAFALITALRDRHHPPVAAGDDMSHGWSERSFWTAANAAVLAFALVPVLWIVSLSLKEQRTSATAGSCPRASRATTTRASSRTTSSSRRWSTRWASRSSRQSSP